MPTLPFESERLSAMAASGTGGPAFSVTAREHPGRVNGIEPLAPLPTTRTPPPGPGEGGGGGSGLHCLFSSVSADSLLISEGSLRGSPGRGSLSLLPSHTQPNDKNSDECLLEFELKLFKLLRGSFSGSQTHIAKFSRNFSQTFS